MTKKLLLLLMILLSLALASCQKVITTEIGTTQTPTTISTSTQAPVITTSTSLTTLPTTTTEETSLSTLAPTTAISTTVSTDMVTTSLPTLAERVNALENPFRIGLFITDSPTTSMGFNFELPIDTTGYIEIKTLDAETYTKIEAVSKARAIGKKQAYLFELTIEDLLPGETYYYRVTSDSDAESDVYEFTLPQANQGAFTFMFLADPQENSTLGYMTYAYTLLSVLDYSEKEYDFVMFPGDMTDDADIKSEWEWLFQYSAMFAFNKPIVATTGNHDASGLTELRIQNLEFDGYMNLPNNGPTYDVFDELDGDLRLPDFDQGKTYSFDYQNTHFVAINTEVMCDGTTTCGLKDETNAEILKTWLRNDLEANTQPWTIVLMHRGPYSLSYDTWNVRDHLVPIFDEFGVDLVLAGHDHQYSRAIYDQNSLVEFGASNPYDKGDIFLDDTGVSSLDFNDYSESIGVTYLTGNTTATKFYGDSRSSGIEVNYQFKDEQPVIPFITVSEDSISVISYVVLKDSGITIVPTGVAVLETFVIYKESAPGA